MADRELFALFERSPIGMYRARRDGSFSYANPALARMLGYATVDDLVRVNLATDIYVEPHAREALIARHAETGVVDGVEVQWKTRDGRRVVVQLYGQMTRDASGEVSFDCNVVDITASKQQRDELARVAHTLELVVEQVPAVYWLTDRDLRILATGGAIERVLGYQPERWLGHTLHEVDEVEPALPDDLSKGGSVAMHLRALAGETLSYTTVYRDKHMSNTIAPHRKDGEIVGVIGTASDVTNATMLERRMIDAQRAESLGVLAGGLAHDFNNLLVAILGNADLALREVAPNAPGRVALENIRNASLRATELTDQLLAYAGRGAVSTERVSPRAILDELLRITAPTFPRNVRVEVDFAPDLAVRAEPAQIRQVLMNLIGNAREALAERGGTIAVRARVYRHDGEPHPDDIVTPAAGSYIEIEIADDGPGIDRETRRHIFEPFFTTKSTGAGLGLAAILGIVRAHGGGLRLDSEPGRGARFSVLWPASFTPGELATVEVLPGLRTVLIIDDEDLVRDVVARMVEDLGYAAVTAPDGIVGLEIVDRQPVDIVLVDLTMPRMNGSEVVEALRVKRPGLPVVLCTGFDVQRRGPVAADAYLPKPFRIDALEQTLARLLPH